MRMVSSVARLLLLAAPGAVLSAGGGEQSWRMLPLIEGSRVADHWKQIGWGRFAVDGDSLRTDCDEKGMGLLLYDKEKFGNCQIRVVFKAKDAKSNAGVFVRVDDGILSWLNKKPE